MFCFLALAMLTAPLRREGNIPHPAPCDPGEVQDSFGMCHCPEYMDCHM
jgi:hypothetical protein